MILKDQVFNQAELLAGEMEENGRELLRLLCAGAVNNLSAQLREGLTPEDCREEFVAAASLYALGQWYAGTGEGLQEFRAGDLTVKKGECTPSALKAQALTLLRPWLKSGFSFMGV